MQLNDRAFDALERVNDRAVATAVAAERERCAKIAEADAGLHGPLGCGPYAAAHARSIARAIRNQKD